MERTPVRGGLKLSEPVGISNEEKTNIKESWNTVDTVEAELAKKGLVSYDQPSFPRPVLTAEHLTTSVNQDYTTLYVQHLAWFNYTTPLLARVKARLLGYTNELKNIETRTRKELRRRNKSLPKEDRLNEKDIEDELWSDPEFLRLMKEVQRFEQYKIEFSAYLETMEQNLKVISRQVEIRKIEFGGNQSENHMPQRWKQPRV